MKSLKLVTPSRTSSSISSSCALGEVGDDHVEAVVDRGLPFGLFPSSLAGLAQRLPLGLDGEVDERGRAAEGRGDACRSRNRRADVVPPNGMSRCVCTSIPPGITSLPAASITLLAFSAGSPWAMAVMRPAAIPMSLAYVSVAVTRVPFLRMVSKRIGASLSEREEHLRPAGKGGARYRAGRTKSVDVAAPRWC